MAAYRREDVLLNKITAFAIAIKECVVNRDGLYAGTRALLQSARYRAEVTVPVLLADGFKHFDRGNAVEFAADITVILQA